ncbi:MAG: family 1 glycosylhydrolase [Porphyrobacter sp.]|nr:family 1 glycosylhydrolase [Porphyrobacter sp.]
MTARSSGTQSQFPADFLWGTATAAHQIEGNNVNSDCWVLENVTPTIFREPSLDAANSLELWPVDLDLVKSIGLKAYRFSLEWARIEPEPDRFSNAMLDHYKAIIEGCRARGLVPIVTYNHFTVPKWFAARGGWLNADAPDLFARFCERSTRHFGDLISHAITLNEPNIALQLWATLPGLMARLGPVLGPMNAAAAKAVGSEQFEAANLMLLETAQATLPNMIAGHRAGRAAIKALQPSLPVGVSLAIADEQVGDCAEKRDAARETAYGAWLEAARGDDFVGVQNYGRNIWDAAGTRPVGSDAKTNDMGSEVHPPSLAGAVRYAHQASGCPVMVTEHGVGTHDDTIRAWLIPHALEGLKAVIDEGVPVLGYMHWSLLDNFEWIFGYEGQFGLCSFDRETFARKPKPSAAVLGAIAQRNGL